MDIARMSMAMSQSNVQQQVSIALMKNTMDYAEGNAANLINQMLSSSGVKAIQQAAQPHLGGNIDILA